MFAPADRAACFHGEQVGVATVTMARIQQQILAGGPPRLSAPAVTAAELGRRFGAETGASCWREFARKPVSAEAVAALERRLAQCWDDIVRAVGAIGVPARRIESVLRRAGCPTTPREIGVAPAFYASAVRNARFLRDRYTFLDLADDSGHLATRCPA
jgi:glycerol-1-phosphate dehydrogenase [NAD(P)+]